MSNDYALPDQALLKVSGAISNFRCTRSTASFVLTQRDRTGMGIVAAANGLAGLSGAAIATASLAGDTEEDADFLEFDIQGHPPVRGWVWRSPFRDGDVVEVVAERRTEHLELVAMTRPQDRIIALYPHCSRGRIRHQWIAAKWWLIITFAFNALLAALLLAISSSAPERREELIQPYTCLALGSAAFFGLMVHSLSAKWMPFVETAQRVFAALGWPNPTRIDLSATTRAQRS